MSDTGKDISRRTFLRGSLLATAATVLGIGVAKEAGKLQEKPQPTLESFRSIATDLAKSQNPKETNTKTMELALLMSDPEFKLDKGYAVIVEGNYQGMSHGVHSSNTFRAIVNSSELNGKPQVSLETVGNSVTREQLTDPTEIARLIYGKKSNVSSVVAQIIRTDQPYDGNPPEFLAQIGLPKPDKYRLEFIYRSGIDAKNNFTSSLHESIILKSNHDYYTFSKDDDNYTLFTSFTQSGRQSLTKDQYDLFADTLN